MFALTLFFSAPACTPADDATGATADSGPVSTFESTLDAIESSTSAHGDEVLAATDTDAVARAESDYWGTCQGYRETMGSCWDAMSGCGMMGDGWDGWQSWMNDMWAAMQDHHDEMGTCGSLADCHTQEAAWQEQMARMFDQMHEMSPAWSDECGW